LQRQPLGLRHRIGTIATAFGFAPPVMGAVSWACEGTPKQIKAAHINVADSIDLMTNPSPLD
jgi:hypothetical protein